MVSPLGKRSMSLIALLAVLLYGRQGFAAACTCAFEVPNPSSDDVWLFTDILETDFTRLESISAAKDWQRQEFNVSAEAGRGKYSKMFTPSNIAVGPSRTNRDATGRRDGVELSVGANLVHGAVPVAEMDTMRQDIFWGSFRVGMKLTAVKGTCAAFFWYFNDTQEIDMEFLSVNYDQENKTFPVNLVVQSQQSAGQGYDASGTPAYKIVNLDFDPTAAFHEYRFDYLPGKVYFYADSQLLAEMQGPSMPDSAGHVILQHWSNGNAKWSGGPPQEDATIVVSYFKAYFNSSDDKQIAEWKTRCDSTQYDSCSVPNGAASNASDGGHFLSLNHTQDNDDKNTANMEMVRWGHILFLVVGLLFIH